MKKVLVRAVFLIYILSTVFFCNGMAQNKAVQTMNEADVNEVQSSEDDKANTGSAMTATGLGVLCINTVYPSMGIEIADSRDNENTGQSSVTTLESDKTTQVSEESPDADMTVPDVTGKDPQVLIVHTHATESYLPASDGNFHSKGEANTVRDVGNKLAATLEARGIAVVHDKTLHDDPSYNNSYSRSYETIQSLLAKYPSVKCVIDLHRDAVSSTAPAATVSIGGKTCAKYSYVVSNAVSTYSQNKSFVSSLNTIAAEKYSGFTGTVLERGYRYNQDLSSKYLLLEIGFNRNQIEDCRNTAEVFGNILADCLLG